LKKLCSIIHRAWDGLISRGFGTSADFRKPLENPTPSDGGL
jgi:hypothetical protein